MMILKLLKEKRGSRIPYSYMSISNFYDKEITDDAPRQMDLIINPEFCSPGDYEIMKRETRKKEKS